MDLSSVVAWKERLSLGSTRLLISVLTKRFVCEGIEVNSFEIKDSEV